MINEHLLITTSGLQATIAISVCRLDVGRHRTMLEMALSCWTWSKMSRIRWNLADISYRSWVITTSGLYHLYRPSLLFPVVARHRTMSRLVPVSRPWSKMWGSRWNFASNSFRSWDTEIHRKLPPGLLVTLGFPWKVEWSLRHLHSKHTVGSGLNSWRDRWRRFTIFRSVQKLR